MDDKIVSAKARGRLVAIDSAIQKLETGVMPSIFPGREAPAGITFVARLPIQEMIKRR
jgi:hypothetical protein